MLIFEQRSVLLSCFPGVAPSSSPKLGERQYKHINIKCINEKEHQQFLSLPFRPPHGLGPCPLPEVAGPLLGATTTSDKVAAGYHSQRLPERLPGLPKYQANYIRRDTKHSRDTHYPFQGIYFPLKLIKSLRLQNHERA